MIFAYLDTGLMNDLGHHANSARGITREVKARGIPCAIFGYCELTQSLRDDLVATPWFRHHTYAKYDEDPICGWLTSFNLASQGLSDDLGRIRGISASDMIYVNSVQPPQFMGVLRWAQGLPPDQRPTVVMEFGTDPGLVLAETAAGPQFVSIDPRIDSRAVLYRYTAKQLRKEDRDWLRLATFDGMSSQAYQMLLDFPVGTLPLPQQAVTGCRDRTGARPVTVSFLGHQRSDKGFEKVPSLVARLLAGRDDIRVLVHNGWPEGMMAQQQQLRDLAAGDPRLELDEQTADGTRWARLLDRSDLIVCPYVRNRFITSYSAVASEAMANAIPLVVPEGTSLHAVTHEFGGPGTTFTEETVEGILAAVNAALDDFDRLAGLAKRASSQWGQTRGTRHLVDTLLSWQAAS